MRIEARDELAAFLRARREALTPQDVGLAPGPRRRSPGLRREEVAVLAGVSTTWYTYLEQARDVQPSAAVLDALARALHLSAAERRHLHVLALGVVPVGEVDDGDGDGAVEAARAIVLSIESASYPVYAATWRGDVLFHNPAVAGWYTDFGARPADDRNMLRWMLLDPSAISRVVNWETEARDLSKRLRAMGAGRGDDARYIALVRDLRERSPEFATWWGEQEVGDQAARHRTLDHPEHGTCTFALTVVYPGTQRDVIIVFHTPIADDGQ